ncbi:MAG: T9SS type A sorting domain-containing protein [Candidatus Eisenbacteria bacterium]|nr:T9SS type A sorting domain-containing protein [Candidatus Eisenbacteria bacterium]
MRACANVFCVVLSVFLGILLLPTLVAASPSVVNATAALNYVGGEPGNQTYRLDYTVENVDVQPSLSGFVVFFDSDGLNRSDFVSYEAPAGWEDVFVTPEAPDGSWNLEWDELYGTNRILPGGTLGGFSITFTWNDPNSLPSVQFFEAWNGDAHEGYTVVVPGSSLLGGIEGTIVTVCGGTCGGGQTTAPAAGVTVDLFTTDNVLLEGIPTDVNGHYSFIGLAIGDYNITVVTPAGFVADQETKTTSVSMGQPTVVDFQLSCLQIKPDARSHGYWKHQLNSFSCGKCGKCGRDKTPESRLDYLCHKCGKCGNCGKGEAYQTFDNYLCSQCSRCGRCGKGKEHETLDDMLYYIEEIDAHFNRNLLNPVKMILIDPETGEADQLKVLDKLLTVNRYSTMRDKAKMQALALLLNVVSLKISQAQVISADGANVSQAVTYVNELIMDMVTSNDERAKDIAEYINNGRRVPSGWIPTSTPVIYYERDRYGSIDYLGKGFPNPFSSTASISFGLKGDGAVPVDLKVFDVTGRVVKTLVSDALQPGQHSVSWNGMSEEGAKVSSGIYFYELKTPTGVATGKLVYRR